MKLQHQIFLLFLIPLFSFTTHKYYLSLTQITYKSDAKSIQIITSVFMDDIELALNKDYAIDLQLTNKNELKDNDVYFKKYFEEKLQFNVNGVAKNYHYIGKEYEGDLVYIYLEITNINSVKEIEVRNKILTKHFPQQNNLTKFKVGKKNKSILLTAKNDAYHIKYE